jgi:WD40 repeat protein
VKKPFVVVAILALFTSIGLADEKIYDVPNVFSFKYADGWNKGPRKGGTASELDYLVSTGNANASFHAGIGRADYSYDDWIRHTIKTASPDKVLASKGDFVTTGGEKGYKLVWNVKASNGQQFVINNYMFHGKGDTQILLSGTVDAADSATLDPVFDGFAKSFTITKSK